MIDYMNSKVVGKGWVQGGDQVKVRCELQELPAMFFRNNSVIPMFQNSSERVLRIDVHSFSESNVEEEYGEPLFLYDDDGVSANPSQYLFLRIQVESSRSALRILITEPRRSENAIRPTHFDEIMFVFSDLFARANRVVAWTTVDGKTKEFSKAIPIASEHFKSSISIPLFGATENNEPMKKKQRKD